MITIRRSMTVDTFVERVYEHLARPENLVEVWPGLIAVWNVRALPLGGHAYEWIYKMAGTRVRGRSQTREIARNDHVVVQNDEGVPSTFRWSFEPDAGRARVSLEVDYTIPALVLGKVTRSYVEQETELQLGIMMHNLKARLELAPRPTRKVDLRPVAAVR